MKYDVILADPPWKYADKCRHRGGAEYIKPAMRAAIAAALEVVLGAPVMWCVDDPDFGLVDIAPHRVEELKSEGQTLIALYRINNGDKQG